MRRWGVTACSVLFFAGCGSDSDQKEAGGTAGQAETTAQAQPDAELIAQAKDVLEMSKSGYVRAAGVGPYSFDQIEKVEFGPPDGLVKPGPEKRKISLINCIPVGSCPEASKYIERIVKQFGWETQTFNADGTPASYQKAWDSAIATKPDAIVGVANSGALIGKQLEAARDRGIVTINAFQTERSGQGFDAYVDLRNGVSKILTAAYMIASTEAKANYAVIEISGFPDLGADDLVTFMEKCQGCEGKKVTLPVTDVLNPVKLGQAATSLVRSNPDLQYLILPTDSVPISAVYEAVSKAGSAGADVEVLSSDPNPPGLQTVQSGDSKFHPFTPLQWAALGTVDALLRTLADQPVPGPGDWGIGNSAWTPETAPDGEPSYEIIAEDVLGRGDFVAPYEQAWGVTLDE